MPELPDVELFKRILDRHGLDKKIAGVSIGDARILATPASTFVPRLKGAKLVASLRHGKHLLAQLDKGGWLTLHFGMTGSLHAFDQLAEEPPYTRVRLEFAGGAYLAYSNRRMLGRVGLVKDAHAFIAAEALGPDALDPKLDFAAFTVAVSGIRRDVKSVLMDQGVMAGVGNVYADEILFQTGLHPKARIDQLGGPELKRLFDQTRRVLATAVAHGAGSEQFLDRMPKGSLLPERKKGGHCPHCGAALDAFKHEGRTTYCCPRCQTSG